MSERTPSLDALAGDPALALNLSQPEALAALAQVGALEAVLRARLAAGTPTANGAHPDHGADDMLTAEQASRRTGMSTRWLYAQARAGTLPFSVPTGVGSVRFSARGIERWLAQRKEQQRRTAL